MKKFLLWAAALLVSGPAFSQVIYDIDFNRPPQNTNQPVVTGSAPHYVSYRVFGTPTVESAVGGLTDRPLRLDHAGNTDTSFYYDQIGLAIPEMYPASLDLSFDFSSVGLIGSESELALLFDTPEVRNVYFRNDGHIYLFSRLNSGYYQEIDIGTFTEGETFRFRMHLDLVNQQWSAFKNETLLESTPFQFSGPYLYAIRFSYGVPFQSPPNASAVGIDNILLVVPEPAVPAIFLCGLAILRLTSRRRPAA